MDLTKLIQDFFLKLLHELVKIETVDCCYKDLSKLIIGFLYVATGICQSRCMFFFFKLLRGFVKVVLCISRPLPNKTKLKFDPRFQSLLKPLF